MFAYSVIQTGPPLFVNYAFCLFPSFFSGFVYSSIYLSSSNFFCS
nr:MAG TPA: hypothetical protein [Caudoviricetes sp.]